MKPRTPTPEERKLWRDTNRHTKVKKEREPEVLGPEKEIPMPRPPAPLHQTQDPKPKTPLPSLTPLTQRETTRLLKTYAAIEATLDLHGLTKLEAHGRVQQFVMQHYAAGHRHLRIITGKGRTGEGVLRSHLPHWLNDAPLRPLVLAIAHAHAQKGGAGVLHVILKRR